MEGSTPSGSIGEMFSCIARKFISILYKCMDIEFIDKSGRKRIGVLVECQTCQKQFATRKDQPAKYCSLVCSADARKNGEMCVCGFCKKVFYKTISSKCKSRSGFFFCSRGCKDAAQRIGGIKEIMPPHYGTGKNSEAYRKLYKRLFAVEKLVCDRCGYSEFECGIDIHHKDKNHLNNSKRNLVPLCSPCHRALHLGLWNINNGGIT